jgi:hypothetical protein
MVYLFGGNMCWLNFWSSIGRLYIMRRKEIEEKNPYQEELEQRLVGLISLKGGFFGQRKTIRSLDANGMDRFNMFILFCFLFNFLVIFLITLILFLLSG